MQHGGMNIVRFAFLLSNGNQKSAFDGARGMGMESTVAGSSRSGRAPHIGIKLPHRINPSREHKERIRGSTKKL